MNAGVEALGKSARRRTVPLPEWCRLLYLDYRRYRAAGRSYLGTIFLAQGFWASCVYRGTHALVEAMPGALLRGAAKTLAAVLQKVVEVVTGICIPRDCHVGGGLYFPSFGSIILGRSAIGRHCTIEQCVTLGIAGKGEERGRPTIGHRVYIGANSMIIGKIAIGDDALVFPGSVVTRPVPPRAVVMGYPAKIVSYEGSFDWIVYDGMEQDPERRAALEKADRPSPRAG